MAARWLTRRQVAERLGKSVASVRRIEGFALHPRRDGMGVYWFDSEQVDQLASEIASGQLTLSKAFPQCFHFQNALSVDTWTEERRRRREVSSLRAELKAREQGHVRALVDAEEKIARLRNELDEISALLTDN